jgi:hypothetical protein
VNTVLGKGITIAGDGGCEAETGSASNTLQYIAKYKETTFKFIFIYIYISFDCQVPGQPSSGVAACLQVQGVLALQNPMAQLGERNPKDSQCPADVHGIVFQPSR